MFQVRASENRLEVTLSGRLDAASMKQALDDLEREASTIENGTMIYYVVDYQLPSLEGVIAEFARLPRMLGFMGRFRRAAVLSDIEWLRWVSELEGMVIPHMDIKGFPRKDREKAIAWLED